MTNFRLYTFLIAIICCATAVNAQGKYAGSMKKLIGISYIDYKKVKELKGWQFNQGDVITPVNYEETMSVEVFRKGSTRIVVFLLQVDAATNSSVVADVLEIKNVPAGWVVKTGTCKDGPNEAMDIVALAKETKTETMKTIKQAWRCNRDKKRIDAVPVKYITCFNEGAEQF